MKFHSDKTVILTVVVATGALLLAACSSVPKWVDKGGGYMKEKDGKGFYGVGGAMGVREEPLAKENAHNPGPADPGQDMDTYTSHLIPAYSAATNGGDITKARGEQNVE